MYLNHRNFPVHMLRFPKIPMALQNLISSKEEQRTAVYYTVSLTILVSIICIIQCFEHPDATSDVIFAATFSSYCNLAMHCSGILFGVAIARMDQAEKEEAARRAESQKESLI